MTSTTICANCKETIEGTPIVKFGKAYCCQACVFEATERPKPKQCGVPVGDKEQRSN